jgi:hypothetical protein
VAQHSQEYEVERLKSQLYASQQKIKELSQKLRDATNSSRATSDHHQQIIALEQAHKRTVSQLTQHANAKTRELQKLQEETKPQRLVAETTRLKQQLKQRELAIDFLKKQLPSRDAVNRELVRVLCLRLRLRLRLCLRKWVWVWGWVAGACTHKTRSAIAWVDGCGLQHPLPQRLCWVVPSLVNSTARALHHIGRFCLIIRSRVPPSLLLSGVVRPVLIGETHNRVPHTIRPHGGRAGDGGLTHGQAASAGVASPQGPPCQGWQ